VDNRIVDNRKGYPYVYAITDDAIADDRKGRPYNLPSNADRNTACLHRDARASPASTVTPAPPTAAAQNRL
jgi:hypothetical protein